MPAAMTNGVSNPPPDLRPAPPPRCHAIEDFLRSAVAWAEESKDGLEFYEKPENPWKRCADIIYMGEIYE